MPERIWFFQPNTFAIPSILKLSCESWGNLPDKQVRKIVAEREQYLYFHLEMLTKLCSKPMNGLSESVAEVFGLSLRATAIHVGVILLGSMAEIVLLSHGNKRGYRFTGEPTFGDILKVWKINGPSEDVKHIWGSLKQLCKWRNDIHLYNLIKRGEDWRTIRDQERHFWVNAVQVLNGLKDLRSPTKR